MALDRETKSAIVDAVHAIAESATSTVVADYRGMSAGDVTAFRAKARDEGVQVQVVRNTLAKLALKNTVHECLNDVLSGPSMFGFATDDPGAAARLFHSVRRTNPELDVQYITLNGQLLEHSELARIATLPTREQALSQLIGTINAPLNKVAQLLLAVPTQLVRTLQALREQRESAS